MTTGVTFICNKECYITGAVIEEGQIIAVYEHEGELLAEIGPFDFRTMTTNQLILYFDKWD